MEDESSKRPMRRVASTIGLAILFLPVLWLNGCASPVSSSTRCESISSGKIEPVVMAPRTIRPPENPPAGERIELRDRDVPFVLFLPEGWSDPTNRGRLAIHFHTADWVALGEHLRAVYRFPLVTIFLGSGSARYREPFTDTNRFPRLIEMIEAEQSRRGVNPPRIQTVDVSSFSAGYGAVRELVQQPAAFARIHRIVLSDSLYAGLASGADGQGPRVVQREQVECWVPFARAAMRGEKSFVFTYSEIPTAAYASTGECAAAILATLGLKPEPVAASGLAAASEPTYPLRLRADAGDLHFWGYAGRDAGAHMVHPRRLAEVWQALDSGK